MCEICFDNNQNYGRLWSKFKDNIKVGVREIGWGM
jgi:hypothetical protein